jgi:hypothetical protein
VPSERGVVKPGAQAGGGHEDGDEARSVDLSCDDGVCGDCDSEGSQGCVERRSGSTSQKQQSLKRRQ